MKWNRRMVVALLLVIASVTTLLIVAVESATKESSNVQLNTSVSTVLNGKEILELDPASQPELPDESQEESSLDVSAITWAEGVLDNPAQSESSDESSSETSEEDLVRNPLGNETQLIFPLLLTVKDESGNPIAGATVLMGDETILTDESGYASLISLDDSVELIITADGYQSYYAELDLSETSALEVTLETMDWIRELLDSAELHPYYTNNEDLEAYLDALFDELFTPEMDTYSKVKACYDYLIEHTYYKSPSHWDNMYNYWLCAYQVLVDGYGTCNCYSAAFTVMMRHIGLNCYIVTGTTAANNGGTTSHDWTTIEIGGKYYIFDAQVEDAIANRTSSKEVTYVRFCLKEPNSKYSYSSYKRDTLIKRFDKYLAANGYFAEDEDPADILNKD